MKQERTGYIIANALLLFAALLIAHMLTGCTTFERAFRKYGTSHVDTTYVTVSQTVPRDSAVLHLVTDTTTVYREIRQGRARVIYERNPKTTIVRAECDSIVIEKKVPQYITRQVWGVDPKFKDQAKMWRTVAFVLIVLIGAGAIAYLFTQRLKLSFSKR